MAGRGRGRGRGFSQIQFLNSDQPNVIPIEKNQSPRVTATYPPHDQIPASLVINTDYNDMNALHDQCVSHFQSSNYYLTQEDERAQLFASGGEKLSAKKVSLNFDWDLFPLELRPVGHRKVKDETNLPSRSSGSTSRSAREDLSWLDILAKREENEPGPSTATVKEEPIKTEPILPDDEVEEFDDEELDADTDYMANYFDSGEGYLEEDDDMDEPCY